MGKPKTLRRRLVDTWRNRENLGLLLGRFYCMGIQARLAMTAGPDSEKGKVYAAPPGAAGA